MSGSEFNLIGGQYIFKGDRATHYVRDRNYAGRLLDKIREIESQRDADVALKVLDHMEQDGLKFFIRRTTDLDQARAQKEFGQEQRRKDRGTKYFCKSCDVTFYDLHREDLCCPKCGEHKGRCQQVN